MLKQRIITARFLIPIVLWSIFNASVEGFTYGLAVVLFLSTLEWNNFVAYSSKAYAWLFSIITTASFIYIEYLADILIIQNIIYLSLVWWLLSLPLLFSFPYKETHLLQKKTPKVIIGFIMLLSTFLALNLLRNSGKFILYT